MNPTPVSIKCGRSSATPCRPALNTYAPQTLKIQKQLPMDWTGTEKSDKKHRAYKTKKKTGDPRNIKQYMDIKHQVQKRTCKAYWDYVEDIVTPKQQENQYAWMKRLWTYVKHKRKDNVCVSLLKNEGRLFSYPVDMAELINKQLQSVFSSREEVTQAEFIQSGRMPPNEKQFPVMEEINITLNGIIKLLKELNPYKPPGPNNLRPRVLKEPADDVALLLLLIYRVLRYC